MLMEIATENFNLKLPMEPPENDGSYTIQWMDSIMNPINTGSRKPIVF